ncbi:N-6 DNA methylase (plasmid) [Nitrosococcus halophilus Nc 4]|uniref:site-specific DNA-methyltransferase (adenine-specific) n=1 Tax=Nitrosococcus halophilus (strain Nc4) TaxID=472759 RepID=D5C5C0_NITHN|nr:class I SAM-dependent DNA methyltransferase [Nitrosococcus halophilus]ADE16974.1 N-6 DNA methylase [Nitrosococcus halophilus Nc 4]
MITGTLKSQVDRIWDAFWSGGISNPLTVIEQITYLLFTKRLDELHTVRERKANRLGKPIEDPIFSAKQQPLRWSRFKDREAGEMYELFRDEVFPFIKKLHEGRESAYSRFMKDAVFVIPTPNLLQRVVTMLEALPMEDRDTKGDLYEYMLSKIATAGQNGQFRTPRHIIKMMVELVAPTPQDTIADPACGTCGFLVAAGEYLREHHPDIFHDAALRQHFNHGLFHGTDFDSSMLRIGAMNMTLHGVEDPDIRGLDSLSQEGTGIRDRYTVILANPPFKGSLDYESVAKDLLRLTSTKKTELLFLALFLCQLKAGGRCACIVPDGVLFGSSKAHREIRRHLVEDHKLDGVISMPSGVFKPYAGVSTAILIFTRTDSGGTDQVWFYDMAADGFSLDDKREPVKENDIPDILAKWKKRNPKKDTDRTAKAFFVPKAEIAENKYDLSINRYKEVQYEAVEYEPPLVILDQLEALETEIQQDLKELREMVG